MARIIIVFTTLLLTALFGRTAELSELLLTKEELPPGVRFLKPGSVRKPAFLKGKNRVIFSDPDTVKEFSKFYLRNEGFASNFKAISLTICNAPVNEAAIFGHQLRDPGKVKELKKAYEFLTSQLEFYRYFESGDIVLLVLCPDDQAKEHSEALAKAVQKKLDSKTKTEGATEERSRR